MAKLQLIEASGVALPQTGQRAPRVTGNAEAAGALTLKFADVAFEEAKELQRLRQAGQLSERAGAFRRELDALQVEFDKDPDHATKPQRYQDAARRLFDQHAQGLDRETATAFQLRANEYADAGLLRVRSQARADEVQAGVVRLDKDNDELINRLAGVVNPAERAAILRQVEGNIDAAQQSGLLTGARYEAVRKATLVKADQAEALRLIRANPGGAPSAIMDVRALPHLDLLQREQLVGRARDEAQRQASLAEARASRLERQQARADARLGDDLEKWMDRQISDGQLSEAELEKARPFLKPNDYRRGLSALRGGAEIDDAATINRLTPRLDDPDVQRDLDKAHADKLLRTSTYQEMRNRARTYQRDDRPATPFRRGREAVKDALDPQGIFQDTAGAAARQGRAAALQEFDTWVEKNPTAEPDAVIGQANDIIRRYSLVQFDKISTALGVPRGVPQERTRDTLTLKDLDAAEDDLLKRYDAREYSREQVDQQRRAIEGWRKVIELRERGKAQPPQKPGERR